jgi:tRNA pseudouridine13 synthase
MSDLPAPSSSAAPTLSLPSFLARPLTGFDSATTPRLLPANVPAGGPIEFRGDDDGFEVEELPAYLPCGTGDHLYLFIEKRGVSTPQVYRRLQEAFGLHERDIGSAGQKDARGITRQWVSVPARSMEEHLVKDHAAVEEYLGFRILQHGRHGNKLRLGHNRGNRFVCRLDGTDVELGNILRERAAVLQQSGLPNWFGPQRFGHNDRAIRDGERFCLRPKKAVSKREQFWVSALQSVLFNAWLADRLTDGTWATAIDGDMLEKRENGAPFLCDDVATDAPRAERGEVSATGPLPGASMRSAARAALTRESRSAELLGVDMPALLVHPAFSTGTRRVGRVWAGEIDVQVGEAHTTVAFSLPSGSYASVFLWELVGPRFVDRFFDAPPAPAEAGASVPTDQTEATD